MRTERALLNRWTRPLAIPLTLSLLTLGAAGTAHADDGPAAAPVSAVSMSPDTLTVTGVILSAQRRPVADQSVTLSVLRPLGDGDSQSDPLATVATDGDGFFAAPVDVAELTGLRAPLELAWVRDGRTSFYFLDAIRAAADARWQVELPPLSELIRNPGSQLGYDLPLQTNAGLAVLDDSLRATLGLPESSGEGASVHMTSSSQLDASTDPIAPEETAGWPSTSTPTRRPGSCGR